MDNLIYAHAAGVFDVKGTIILTNRAYKGAQRQLEVRLTAIENRWSVLEHLKNEFGGTITNYSPSLCSREKPRKCWVVVSTKAKDFLLKIQPYIQNTRRKKQVGFICRRFRYYDRRLSTRTKRQTMQYVQMEVDWFKL